MKVLVTGLIAGLVLSISLVANATTTYLKCTLMNGEDMSIRMETVMNPVMTSLDYTSMNGVTFTATAVYDLVNVYAKVNGVTVGNSGKNSASLDVLSEGREPVSLSCELTDQTPF